MSMKTERKPLARKELNYIHDLLDELISLHNSTLPKHKKRSAQGKTEKADRAIVLSGILSGILSGWAEQHLLGQAVQNANVDNLDEHGYEISISDSSYIPEIIDDDETFENFRDVIAYFIRRSIYNVGLPMYWRAELSEALVALNEGQSNWLFIAKRDGKHGNQYNLGILKKIVVMHAHKLKGEGWKLTAARTKVHEMTGLSVETLRAWERELFKNSDELKKIEVAASFPSELKSRQDVIAWRKKLAFKKDASFIDEDTFSLKTLLENYPLETIRPLLEEAMSKK